MRLWSKLLAKLTLIAATLVSATAFADQLPKFNMHYGVTPISKDMYDLHMTVFGICCVIGVIVFTILIIALIRHRKSKGHEPAKFHENTTIEILWATIPFVILIIMAIPATIVLRNMNNYDDSSLTIKITGYQWKWQYQYMDQGISFFSNLSTPLSQINNEEKKSKWYLLDVNNPLVVPVHEKIRFLITSNDVIHSWWVPALGVKKDAMPGFIHEAWAEIDKPGTYRGQCTELCGANHGFMPIVVVAKTKPEFEKWVKEQQGKQAQLKASQQESDMKTYTFKELMAMGKKNYNMHCAACHQASGKGIPPIYPALHADSVAVGDTIARHIDIVLHGVPGSAMQAFDKQLTDTELASIITYERNAWDNNTGDIVQPSDIQKQRDKLQTQYQDKVKEMNKAAEMKMKAEQQSKMKKDADKADVKKQGE